MDPAVKKHERIVKIEPDSLNVYSDEIILKKKLSDAQWSFLNNTFFKAKMAFTQKAATTKQTTIPSSVTFA